MSKEISPDNPRRPAFYLTFWQLSTYDLSPPASRYDEECTVLRLLSRSEDSKFVIAERSADRVKHSTAPIHKERRNRINDVVSKLGQEFKEQTAARAFTIKRLAREKQHWFAHSEWIRIPGTVRAYVSFRPQGHRPCGVHHRVLHSATMLDLTNGRRLLCSVHQGDAPAGHSGLLYVADL